SKTCICTDATNMNALDLSFDLRQTFSKFWETNLNQDSSFIAENINILRVTVNGQEVGQRYSPVSHEADPYQTKFINLDAQVGQKLNICFEGLVNQSRLEDPFGIGDFITIDNINLTPTYTVSSNELTLVEPGLILYPNPTQNEVFVNFNAVTEGKVEMVVRNVLGQVMQQATQNVQIGSNKWGIDLTGWARGIYLVEVKRGEQSFVQKLIVE
ncbi:MAG: T9SS type A sorting domain-containing protein, partial [Bacteroidota bacterium]